MANMTIENIGGMMRNGNLETVLDHGRIEGPNVPQVKERHLPDHASTQSGGSFGEMLEKSLEKVNDMQLQADRAAKELLAGRNKNIHETMLMIEKADMSYRLMMQVRNKVVEAYREIMRMQV